MGIDERRPNRLGDTVGIGNLSSDRRFSLIIENKQLFASQ